MEPIPKSVRGARNLVALSTDLAERRTRWESRPAVLEYAPSSACNLKCPMCAQADPKRRVVSTPRERRTKLYEELFPSTTLLKPFTLSEPLINDFEEMSPYLARHGVKLDVVTNATLLTPRNLELVLPHLHRITFSVDSHVKKVFEKVRPPAKFEEVDRNIRHAMPALREAGVLVRINMVLVRDQLPHLEDFVDYVVDQYGCSYLDVFELNPYMPGSADMDPFADPGETEVGRALERLIVRAEQRRLNLDLIVRAPFTQCRVFEPPPTPATSAGVFEDVHQKIRKHHPGFCEQAMMYLKVNPDGESYPCCKAPEELRLGNVFRDGLDGVWNSEVAQELRRRMFRGDYPAPCQTCVFFRFSRTTAGAPASSWLERLRFRGYALARWSRAARRDVERHTEGVREWGVHAADRARGVGQRYFQSSRYKTREAVRRAGRALRLPRILG